jgi:hypothetical protein
VLRTKIEENDMRTGAPEKNRQTRYENWCIGKNQKKNDMTTGAPEKKQKQII